VVAVVGRDFQAALDDFFCPRKPKSRPGSGKDAQANDDASCQVIKRTQLLKKHIQI